MRDTVMKRDVLKTRSAGSVLFDIFNYTFLGLFAFSIAYPFWNMILASFSKPEELLSLGFHLWIRNWDTHAWQYVLQGRFVAIGYFNTVFRTAIGTPFTLMVTLFAAYPLSRRGLPGRTWITIYFLVIMFFSGGLIPTYLLVKGLGLINSRWALILPPAVNVFYIIIMRNYLMTIDEAMEESALMDGANYPTILFRIIMPLARPVVATIVLWTAVAHWNAWFDAMIYINDKSKMVLQILVRRLIQQLIALPEIREFQEDMGIQLPTESMVMR